MAKDLGIVAGIPGNLFAPKNKTKRDEAPIETDGCRSYRI
ncbi:S-layer homology domain-containing protein [Clostridium thermosuccinogenes]|nr:hypothetical protein CDQ83_04065 [Pseudoclostridium thermosuccinogenes]